MQRDFSDVLGLSDTTGQPKFKAFGGAILCSVLLTIQQ